MAVIHSQLDCSMNLSGRRILFLALSLAFAFASASAQIPAPSLVPGKISMGPFYYGTRLHIEGTAPAGTGVIIVVRGSDQDQFFNRKSQIGPIWLSSDRIHLQHAPSVLFSYSSGNAQAMLDRVTLDQNLLDEASILHHLHCFCRCKCNLTKPDRQTVDRDRIPSASYRAELEADFLKLKEHEGVYCTRSYSVHLTPDNNGRAKYALDLRWPATIPPGRYQVEVCICSQQRIVARSTRALDVVETGFPGYIQHLAVASPEEYGIDAVLVALIAGFATDLLSTLPGLRRRRAARMTADRSAMTLRETHAEEQQSHEVESIHLD